MLREDDSSSTSSSSNFMSPFAPFRAIFPAKSPKVQGETLQANKDSSWIGARMSPVAFDDDDVSNEDREVIAPYHKALKESIDSSFSNESVTERTALLGRRRYATRSKPRSKPHPVWGNEDLLIGDGKTATGSHASKNSSPRYSWDIILCALSGFHLSCMALHDLYVWYLAYRSGHQSNKDLSWRLPWLSPSTSTLQRFGALIPMKVVHGQPWRIISSIFMCTSLVEYVFMCLAWHTLRVGGSRPTSQWVGLYFMSTMTGQFWTIAWDPSGVSGGAVWGTCGVLCAAGAAKPTFRFVLLVISIALFFVSSIGATSSAMGAIGSSAFGWGYYGMGRDMMAALPPSRLIRRLSGIILVSLWMVPLLWIAFADTYATSQGS